MYSDLSTDRSHLTVVGHPTPVVAVQRGPHPMKQPGNAATRRRAHPTFLCLQRCACLSGTARCYVSIQKPATLHPFESRGTSADLAGLFSVDAWSGRGGGGSSRQERWTTPPRSIRIAVSVSVPALVSVPRTRTWTPPHCGSRASRRSSSAIRSLAILGSSRSGFCVRSFDLVVRGGGGDACPPPLPLCTLVAPQCCAGKSPELRVPLFGGGLQRLSGGSEDGRECVTHRSFASRYVAEGPAFGERCGRRMRALGCRGPAGGRGALHNDLNIVGFRAVPRMIGPVARSAPLPPPPPPSSL